MFSPKISIITISYNSEKTIEDTIVSVINQNYTNLEYIIIDGKSSDKTLSILNKYKNNIDIIISEPDKGISDAFNKGINISTGEIIGIINSDDILLPDALNVIAENYSENIDVYRFNTIIWSENNNKHYKSIPSMEFSLYKLSLNTCHPSTFITNKAYRKWGLYDIKFKYMMDVDLLTRFYIKRANFKYIDFDTTVFRLGGVTDSTIFKKLDEIKYVVLNNDGTRVFAIIKMMYFLVYQCLKKLTSKIVGDHFLKRIKYKA